MSRHVDILPSGLPPRGLSRVQAAAYVGISPTLFDAMVADGRMPKPVRINARTVWDRVKLDEAFAALADEERKATIRGIRSPSDPSGCVVKIDIEYPYLCKDRDRHGNVRFYFRRKGHKKVRIRARPGTSEFQTADDAAKSGSRRKSARRPTGRSRPEARNPSVAVCPLLQLH